MTGQPYTPSETRFLVSLIKQSADTTTAELSRRFIEQYPHRSYNSVRCKVEDLRGRTASDESADVEKWTLRRDAALAEVEHTPAFEIVELPPLPVPKLRYTPNPCYVISSDHHWPLHDERVESIILQAIEVLRPRVNNREAVLPIRARRVVHVELARATRLPCTDVLIGSSSRDTGSPFDRTAQAMRVTVDDRRLPLVAVRASGIAAVLPDYLAVPHSQVSGDDVFLDHLDWHVRRMEVALIRVHVLEAVETEQVGAVLGEVALPAGVTAIAGVVRFRLPVSEGCAAREVVGAPRRTTCRQVLVVGTGGLL